MKRTRAFHRLKTSLRGFRTPTFKSLVKRVLIPKNRKKTFPRLDTNPLKLVKSQVRKQLKKAFIIKGLKNDTPRSSRLSRNVVALSNPSHIDNMAVCKNRANRKKAIMALTRGKGLKVRFAEWKAESKIKCS